MRSGLLRKYSATGYPNEVELLAEGGDRLFEVDSLRKPGSRMLVALPESGGMGDADYPVYDPEKDKVTFQHGDRFESKFKTKVKKHMKGEEEKADTPKEKEEATNDPSLRKAAALKCPKCGSPDVDQSVLLKPKVRCNECKHEWTPGKAAGGVKRMWEDEMLRQEQAENERRTVHDLKPLMDAIRSTQEGDPERIALTGKLVELARNLGAKELRTAGQHYMNTLIRMAEYRDASGRQQTPPRTQRAHDRAWKRLESAYVHFVR